MDDLLAMTAGERLFLDDLPIVTEPSRFALLVAHDYCSSTRNVAVTATRPPAVGVAIPSPLDAVAGAINSDPGAATHRYVALWLRGTLARGTVDPPAPFAVGN
jgi:hypothetical protein